MENFLENVDLTDISLIFINKWKIPQLEFFFGVKFKSKKCREYVYRKAVNCSEISVKFTDFSCCRYLNL